ncbi:putative TetR family transcriptional regulator [Paenibacillus sp. 598K]|nr:putative TetR family transcriptional regulator [Paenibacillus sp. 598K]
MTFFKLYPKKEDLLIYYMRVWLTEQIIAIDRAGLRGFEVVRHLLQGVARESAHRPGMMPSLISFLSEMKMHPRMPELSEAEVRLLFPGQEEQGRVSPNLFLVFLHAMQEAEQEGKLRTEVTVDEAVKVLFTIFYGSFLTAQQFASADIYGFYELHLRLIERS